MPLALITGGAAGLGAAIAREAHDRGYEVAVIDLTASKDVPWRSFIGDVTDEASLIRALDELGAVPDLLVNNAGIVQFAPLLDTTTESFARTIAINLTGAFTMARLVAKGMVERGSGHIVNVTSTAGIATSPGVNAYVPAKRGLAGLTELMAQEWGPSGVRINAVAPGMIDGGMSTGIYKNDAARKLRSSAVPSRRLGREDDIAQAVMWLDSDGASYINGHELVVDGGVTKAVMSLIPRD
ncbi:NAD(P)-dependent dehydrogenase (short-subunit alcohol dehydrogenase family) [Maritimibacter alkaliphilus HTCC2654]|uniref:SDR family NAD(P)-dependent oxidoreductase n=1 Tax=Maritimibacter alkaliphilus TaxID=404236 RepID=UPI000326A846|nr:SDR family oxidoreductase [Maritimibacter alkaliphilus]TYP80077.1 NAD(P)-dependent dehydrogenase (short-subunit alcohol dehydrogenase family) [Maritimibacter alkaliphilus HTCC2654]